MLTFRCPQTAEIEDARWWLAERELLAMVERLGCSTEAARRWAITASADEVEDRVALYEHCFQYPQRVVGSLHQASRIISYQPLAILSIGSTQAEEVA